MASKVDYFLNKTLGEDFFESLQKFDLWKPGTRSVVDHEEIKTALQIVPRTIMSLLIRELLPMQIGDNKDVPLFVGSEAVLKVSKHERDQYSGEIQADTKRIVDFQLRSLPGVGLIIMSAFELYDMENLMNSSGQATEPVSEDISLKVQKLIDERLALHDLISKVVDKKINERDAINKLVLAKITEALHEHKEKDKKLKDIVAITKVSEDTTPNPIEYHRGMTNGLKVAESIITDKEPEFLPPSKKKESPLKGFLENRKGKFKKNEFIVEMAKNESVNCPDCGKEIFSKGAYSACICFGDSGKIHIKKSENGVKIRFGKNWDIENIQMLLEILRRHNGQ